MNRIVLGRGIGALIPDGTAAPEQQASFAEIPVDKVAPNPDQPRAQIDPATIVELSESIKRDGVLQPILVQQRGANFELVAGERRLRAAAMAGLATIPARVLSDLDPQKRAVLALVENLQREDLNPMEEAAGLRELQTQFGLSQEEVATAVGKDRSTIANTIRILQLPTKVREAIASGQLTAGHGRALLALSETGAIERTANLAIQENWSVRQLEREIAGGRTAGKKGKPMKMARQHKYLAVEEALKRKYGTQVVISHRLGKGKVEFEYYSENDLTRLIDLFEVRLD